MHMAFSPQWKEKQAINEANSNSSSNNHILCDVEPQLHLWLCKSNPSAAWKPTCGYIPNISYQPCQILNAPECQLPPHVKYIDCQILNSEFKYHCMSKLVLHNLEDICQISEHSEKIWHNFKGNFGNENSFTSKNNANYYSVHMSAGSLEATQRQQELRQKLVRLDAAIHSYKERRLLAEGPFSDEGGLLS